MHFFEQKFLFPTFSFSYISSSNPNPNGHLVGFGWDIQNQSEKYLHLLFIFTAHTQPGYRSVFLFIFNVQKEISASFQIREESDHPNVLKWNSGWFMYKRKYSTHDQIRLNSEGNQNICFWLLPKNYRERSRFMFFLEINRREK